jgi:hypothetical protein
MMTAVPTLRSLLRVLVLVAAVGMPSLLAAQTATVRGVVTDSAGNPLRGVEILVLQQERSTRTGSDGRFVLRGLPWGQVVLMARQPGWRAQEQVVRINDDGTSREPRFVMLRAIQLLDTLRIVSQDGCAATQYTGFECRRRAGIGQFRGPDELEAIRAQHMADMFEGMTGLRREPFMDPERGRLDWTVASTAGWRCLTEAYNGRFRTAREEVVYPEQIYAIEYYDVYERVPEAYKRFAWPNTVDKPCGLVVYWTKAYVEENGGPRRQP